MADDGSLSLPIGADARLLEAQLNRAVNALNRSMDTMEARTARGAKNVNRNIESMFGHTEIGKALDKVFDSSRLAVMEEGSAKLRVFGSALEPLGVYGFAAAAGVAALGLAIEKGKEVAEWAEGLEKASRTLGLTTTQLQQFDFVAQATGIDVAKNREALSGLERTIGAVADGSAKARQLKIFTDGLKITPADLQGWGSLAQQFPHIVDALAKVNVEARADFASKLKIDPEVLQSWIDQREHMRGLIDEANRLGIVLDEAGVAKMAEAGDEMRHTGAIIQGELNVALADMVPLLGAGARGLAGMVEDAANVERGLHRAASAVVDFIGWVDQTVPALGALDKGALDAIGGLGTLWSTLNHLINPLSIVVDLLKQLGASPAGPKPVTRGALDGLLHPEPALKTLVNGGVGGGRKGGRGGATGPSLTDLTRTADEDLDRAQKGMADAMRQASNDMLERSNLEEAAINAEADAQQQKLRRDREKATADVKLSAADTLILEGKYDTAAHAIEVARDAKLQANDQKLQTDSDHDAIELQKRVNTLLSGEARIRASLATTAAARNRLEMANLLEEQKLDRRDLNIEEQAAMRGVSDPGRLVDIAGHFNQLRSAQSDLQQAQRDQLADSQLGPLGRFAKDASSQDWATELQTNAVEAMKTLNSGLVEAITSGKSLGDTLKNVFKKFLSDVLNQGLQGIEGNLLKGLTGGGTDILSTLAHFIPFFASGTNSAPGGLAMVGERGPELVNLSRGAQVIPNHMLNGLKSAGGGPRTVQVSIAYDMSGTSGDDAINRKIAVATQQSGAQVFEQVRRAMPGWQVQGSYERG